jgi:hypothetical protein
LGDGVFLPTPHHPRGPLDEPHPARPGEDYGKRAPQRRPPCPQLCRLVDDASPSSASVFGFSIPNRSP